MTLNQILSRLRAIALSHKQINSVRFGEPHEFPVNEYDVTYPALFISSEVGNIDRVNKQQQYVFRFHFYDLVHVATDTEANEEEVLSDMSQVADDFLAMLANPVYQFDWMLADTALKALPTEQTDDMVAGAQLEIGLLIDYIEDSCIVPADDVDFPQITLDMGRTRLITYTATGSEGNSWVIAAISGKNVITAFRAEWNKRVTTSAPPDTGYLQVDGSVLSENRGVLVATGQVTLFTGDIPIADEKFDFLIHE